MKTNSLGEFEKQKINIWKQVSTVKYCGGLTNPVGFLIIITKTKGPFLEYMISLFF